MGIYPKTRKGNLKEKITMDNCAANGHSVNGVTSRGRIIAYGIMDVSQSAFTGIGNLDFTRMITYFRYYRIIHLLEDLIPELEDISLANENEAIEVTHLLGKLIKGINTVLGAGTAPFNYYRRDKVIAQLKQKRDQLFDILEDMKIAVDSVRLKESKARIEAGHFVEHDDFWNRLGVQN